MDESLLMKNHTLNLDRDGAFYAEQAAWHALPDLFRIIAPLAVDQAGQRLVGLAGLAEILGATGPIGGRVSSFMDRPARPVRAILFDKNEAANWALGWHQDRTIAVRERIDVPGFGPWTVKQAYLHVAPPMDVLNAMLTIRIHLDPVPADNAPLLIALGTHRLGRISEKDVGALVAESSIHVCTADAGDMWLYRTPILHASERATTGQRRRVLQVDYAAQDLPGGLEWIGV